MRTSVDTRRRVLFWIFAATFVATMCIILYAYIKQVGAPDKEIPFLRELITLIVVAAATAFILYFRKEFLSRNTTHPESIGGPLEYSLPNSDLVVLLGNIHEYNGKGRTVVYPTSAYFDTRFGDKIVAAKKSTWGQYLDMHQESIAAIDDQIDESISSGTLPRESSSIQKPGRQDIFKLGSTIRITSETDDILLFASARLSNELRSVLTESELSESLRQFWERISELRNIHDMFMPLVGAGLGRINKRVVLANMLLTYQDFAESRSGKICDTFTIVIYSPDWEDGRWVKNICDGLLGPNDHAH